MKNESHTASGKNGAHIHRNRLKITMAAMMLAALILVPAVNIGKRQIYDAEAASAASKQTAQPLPASLQQAKQEFDNQNSISETAVEQLRKQKEAVIPIAVREIEGNTSADTLPFWFMVAQKLQDDRMAQALLHWWKGLDAQFRYSQYKTYEAFWSSMAAYRSPNLDSQLLGAVAGSPDWKVSAIVRFLAQGKSPDDTLYRKFLQRYAGQPQVGGLIDYLRDVRDWAHLKTLYERQPALSEDLQSRAAAALLEGYQWYASDVGTLQWLKQAAVAAGDHRDWKIEQQIDMYLVLQHGDKQAAARLYQSGMAAGFLLPLDGRVEQILAKMYPQGKLAQGIRAYEAIRGRPYFIDWRKNESYSPEGNDFAHPKQAAAKWRDFLRQYPKHPAADDAAYRLARCEEMTGQYAAALKDYLLALHSGDQDMPYDASGMMVYTLDLEMTTPDFQAMDKTGLPDWLQAWVSYSQAVNLIRDRQYGQAKEALQTFMRKNEGRDLFAGLSDGSMQNLMIGWRGQTFWKQIHRQYGEVAQIAALQAKAEAASGAAGQDAQYAVAAFIFHHPMLYYNCLWEEDRADFLAFKGGYDAGADIRRYESRFNPYVQAVKAFQAVDLQQADSQTAAKTLFSLALSSSKIIDFGQESTHYDTRVHLVRQITDNAQQLIANYSVSPLADDAEMLIYAYTGDKSRLTAVLTKYPDGDQAAKAKTMLNSKNGGLRFTNPSELQTSYYGGEILSPMDWRVPGEISQWADAHQGVNYHGWRLSGGWLYIYISAAAGSYVERPGITIGPDGTAISFYQRKMSKQGPASYYRSRVLVRLPGSFVDTRHVAWKKL